MEHAIILSLLVFLLLIFLPFSLDQLTIFAGLIPLYSEQALCKSPGSSTIYPSQALFWSSFRDACCCTTFLMSVVPQDLTVHISVAFFLYSIPSNFLELIVNSESEDVVSNSPWITTENTGFVTLFFFFLFFPVLNEPFLYHPGRILNLMSLAFYHSIFCADMVGKKRGFSSSQTCRKVIVQFHCQEVTYLLNAKSVLFLHQNIFSPNLFNQHSHILCSGIFLKHLESTASRMVRCLTTFL